MSDIPRFAFFSDGMREGYNERWVRSSDYDALRAERDAQRARADENELCASAVVEIRRLCKEIMGGNLSFVDDDFARCLLTLRAERDAAVQAIREHNEGCDTACEANGVQHCVPYVSRGRRCPDCPRDWRIEYPESAATGQQS